VRASHLTGRHEIAERYKESEIVGAPEVREGGAWGAGFMLAQIATTPPANNLYGSFA